MALPGDLGVDLEPGLHRDEDELGIAPSRCPRAARRCRSPARPAWSRCRAGCTCPRRRACRRSLRTSRRTRSGRTSYRWAGVRGQAGGGAGPRRRARHCSPVPRRESSTAFSVPWSTRWRGPCKGRYRCRTGKLHKLDDGASQGVRSSWPAPLRCWHGGKVSICKQCAEMRGKSSLAESWYRYLRLPL